MLFFFFFTRGMLTELADMEGHRPPAEEPLEAGGPGRPPRGGGAVLLPKVRGGRGVRGKGAKGRGGPRGRGQGMAGGLRAEM